MKENGVGLEIMLVSKIFDFCFERDEKVLKGFEIIVFVLGFNEFIFNIENILWWRMVRERSLVKLEVIVLIFCELIVDCIRLVVV